MRPHAASPSGACPSHEHLRLDPRARLPDPDPRGRPLLRRPGRRDEPAQVLPRLPARAREDEAQRDRVRRRRGPARRLREDPGHAPPRGRAIWTSTSAEPSRRTRRSGAPWTSCARGSRRATTRARATPSSSDLPDRSRHVSCRPSRSRPAERGLGEIGDALAPDAYWRAKTWKRVAVIFAGPGANLLLAVVLFALLFMAGGGKATRTVDEIVAGHARRDDGAAGGRSDRRDQRQAGRRRRDRASDLGLGRRTDPGHRRAGRQDGRRSARSQPAKTDGAYRLGFILRGEGLGPVESTWQAVRVTGIVTKEIGASIGRLVTGDGRDEISSPVGIVQGSSEARRAGRDHVPLGARADQPLARAAEPAAACCRSTAATSRSR